VVLKTRQVRVGYGYCKIRQNFKLKTAEGTMIYQLPGTGTVNLNLSWYANRKVFSRKIRAKITGMHGHRMSLRDISAHIKDIYAPIFLLPPYQPLPIR
jgi:hypothetical protein